MSAQDLSRNVSGNNGAFYELRRYLAHPGRRAELVQLMDEQIIPFMRTEVMDVTASFVDAENPDI